VSIGIRAVLHINVNCTVLDRSVEFYRQVAGLTPISHTAPEAPQPGGAFALDTAQWDAWIMAGPRRFERTVVDLLEWKVPPPSGRPARRGERLGFETLRLAVPDVGAAMAAASSLGAVTVGPDACEDPDGTILELVGGPAGPVGVTIRCSEPDRSSRFYTDVIGLARGGDRLLRDETTGFSFELLPADGVAPAPAAATSLGMWRLAFATDDIGGAVEELAGQGVHCLSAPVTMSMGPGLPELSFVCFPDPDGTMLELIEQPPA
jgi:catechol 2,3-dioxygenase-like lactoylglutathione lyase family enzyme